MQPMKRVQFATSVMIDGAQQMAGKFDQCESMYFDGEKYVLKGRRTGEIVWVHPSNVQWALPDMELSGNKGTSNASRART